MTVTANAKQCPKCDTIKHFREFYREAGKKDGLSFYCKPCHRDSVQKGRESTECREYNSRRIRTRYAEHSAIINAYKLSEGCKDCGYSNEQYPSVLDFDHLPGTDKYNKVRRNAVSLSWSLKKIFEEIAKCEVVCANCHRIRTASRREESVC